MSGAEGLSRRALLQRGALLGGGIALASWLPLPRAARAAAASKEPVVLSPEQWKTLEAMTARILPTDTEAGAREAHCVNFIDKALADEEASARPLYEAGLAAADAAARAEHGKPFAELAPAAQDALLERIERGDLPGWPAALPPSPVFFEALRAHTLIGFLADPRYGGNHDYAGWRVTGYPGPRHRRGGYTREQLEGEAPVEPVWSWKPK